jgi:transcription termination factor Rho
MSEDANEDEITNSKAVKKTAKKKVVKKKVSKKKVVAKKALVSKDSSSDAQLEMDFGDNYSKDSRSDDKDDPIATSYSADDDDDDSTEAFSVFKKKDKTEQNDSQSTDDDVRLPENGGNENPDNKPNNGGNEGGNFNFKKKFDKNRFKNKPQHPNQYKNPNHNPNHNPNNPNRNKQKNKQNPNRKMKQKNKAYFHDQETAGGFDYDNLLVEEFFNSMPEMEKHLEENQIPVEGEEFIFNEIYELPVPELIAYANNLGIQNDGSPNRDDLLGKILDHQKSAGKVILATGIIEVLEDGNAAVLYQKDNYRRKTYSVFVHEIFVRHYGLLPGHEVVVVLLPNNDEGYSPYAIKVKTVMGTDYQEVAARVPFTELTPYYPTERIVMEGFKDAGFDNTSLRIVDLISPIGLGQRSLIVAPPRTGKTILLQSIAKSLRANYPKLHLIILLVDERPEEVTDFRRQVDAEVISSTFDENADSHVHAAEMVIEKARRMVEAEKDVAILLDSITRLARAYNTSLPNSGKILSGGVEANALQRPKRFFGSARNIEGGGSLTIIGTALVETGSKMDEVIFEEFKGTGNMELHLDRAMSDKRIYPALSMDKSGTRKEELLYHPDELNKVYSLRRAMKGVPPVDAMESLIQRVKKTKTNIEFLMTLGR